MCKIQNLLLMSRWVVSRSSNFLSLEAELDIRWSTLARVVSTLPSSPNMLPEKKGYKYWRVYWKPFYIQLNNFAFPQELYNQNWILGHRESQKGLGLLLWVEFLHIALNQQNLHQNIEDHALYVILDLKRDIALLIVEKLERAHFINYFSF